MTAEPLRYVWCQACGLRWHRTPSTSKPCSCGGTVFVTTNPNQGKRKGRPPGVRRKWSSAREKCTAYLEPSELDLLDRLRGEGESRSDVLRRALIQLGEAAV